MIFGNWLWPSRRRQVFCAPSTSLNTMASAVLFERRPFERVVLCRTVAKVLSIGFDVRKCFQGLVRLSGDLFDEILIEVDDVGELGAHRAADHGSWGGQCADHGHRL